MFGLAPLVNPSSVIPRLHLRNESTDLNITLTIYNYKPLFYVHMVYLKYLLTCWKQILRLKDVALLYEDWVQLVQIILN